MLLKVYCLACFDTMRNCVVYEKLNGKRKKQRQKDRYVGKLSEKGSKMVKIEECTQGMIKLLQKKMALGLQTDG